METASNPLPREFRLKNLAVAVGRVDEERVLCPVRALRIFTGRLKEVTPKPRNLFVSPSNRSRPLSRNGLSYLLPHDIRGVATSINLLRNKSVAAILDAASWKTPCVFAKHYLRDVERSEGDMLSLGAIVAAGDVVH
ncbi:hypothetical protein E2C01_062156 [Portunus trituberculatus]|uniref:Uncharacterized protein n=1 Tax=Portunus trituberculatus TaxID=210409 RepID=A0A5B7HFC4_PORTR|nr:hypothetical protein [Portunus trituberculatus]